MTADAPPAAAGGAREVPGANAGLATLAHHYDAHPRWGQAPDAANQTRLARTHALVPSDVRTILDAGCGDGSSSNALADSRRVVGADISPRALRFAAGMPVAASITRLPVADRSFDLVMALEVIEHLPDGVFEAALAELARTADRWLLVSTPHAEHLPAGQARCPRCATVFHRDLHFQAFGADDHARLFAGHGFAHRRTERVESWRPSPGWTTLRHGLLGRLGYRPVSTCPTCGLDGADLPPARLPARLAIRAIDAVAWRLTPPVPRWIVSLHERVADPR